MVPGRVTVRRLGSGCRASRLSSCGPLSLDQAREPEIPLGDLLAEGTLEESCQVFFPRKDRYAP